jgi:hypothetical protein
MPRLTRSDTHRKAIDEDFASMADDCSYQEEALQIAEEFARSDWEALQVLDNENGQSASS